MPVLKLKTAPVVTNTVTCDTVHESMCNVTNAVVRCERKLFQNYFSLRGRPFEIVFLRFSILVMSFYVFERF